MENIRLCSEPYEDHLKADEAKLRAIRAWRVLEHIGGENSPNAAIPNQRGNSAVCAESILLCGKASIW